MKKTFAIFLTYITLAFALDSCHNVPQFDNNPQGNFDALWKIIDEHYCFLEYKDVDWAEVKTKYQAKIGKGMTSEELFRVCADMLKELKDGHTNLSSSFDVSRYWIWEQFPKNYDERLIEEHYLEFDYKRANGIDYRILKNNFGYMHYGSFSYNLGEGNLDNILAYMAISDGLIIDIRDNGGGIILNAEKLARRFMDRKTLVGYISHKTGPGHNEFSEKYPYYLEPSKSRIRYYKPVVILCNRATYSAANNFASIMKSLPNVRIVGDITGGGCGMPFTSELPNGWTVRFSASPIYDSNGKLTEFGVEPSEGCKVDMNKADEDAGKDTILEHAFDVLRSML